jgi:hypothetical protein
MVAPESRSSLKDEALSMPRAEVRQRSLTGIFFLTCSGFINLVVGFGATLVFARLLMPADFGVVAVGSTALLLGTRSPTVALAPDWFGARRRRLVQSCER